MTNRESRERLVELIREVDNMRLMRKGFAECADYLLANGVVVLDMNVITTKNRPLITHIAGNPINDVLDLIRAKEEGRLIVPPCKVGDKVWLINNPREYEVLNFHFTGQILWATLILIEEPTIMREINTEHFGKTVFLTKEEAKKVLAERS